MMILMLTFHLTPLRSQTRLYSVIMITWDPTLKTLTSNFNVESKSCNWIFNLQKVVLTLSAETLSIRVSLSERDIPTLSTAMSPLTSSPAGHQYLQAQLLPFRVLRNFRESIMIPVVSLFSWISKQILTKLHRECDKSLLPKWNLGIQVWVLKVQAYSLLHHPQWEWLESGT